MQKIRYIYLLIIIGLILIITIFSFRNRQIANIDSQGENIICFGDSLTSGSNTAVNENYPSILSKMLKRNIINAGRDGDTTATALERLEKDVLGKDPLLVIVILGGNDFLHDIPKSQTFNNLKTIISAIKSTGSMVALGQLGPLKMYAYRDDFRKIAEEENIFLIRDVLSGIFAHPELMSDHIHPNTKGYEKLSQSIYKSIVPILEKNKKIRGDL